MTDPAPPPLRLGLEIEAVFIPLAGVGGRPLSGFASWLAQDYAGTPGIQTDLQGDEYDGPRYTQWEITTDPSLRKDPTRMTYPLELISPILSFDEQGSWRRHVRQVFAHLESKCEIATNSSCGFHVHLSPGDGSRWRLAELKQICLAVLYFEGAFLALLPVSRQNTAYLNNNWSDNPRLRGLSIEEC